MKRGTRRSKRLGRRGISQRRIRDRQNEWPMDKRIIQRRGKPRRTNNRRTVQNRMKRNPESNEKDRKK